MAIRKLRAAAAAAVLTLSLGLTACSSDDDATSASSKTTTTSSAPSTDGTKAASTASADAATECTYSLADAKTGDTVSGREFAFCQAEALTKLEGYVLTRVQTDDKAEEFTSVTRVQVDPLEVEITSEEDSGGTSSVVIVDGKAYIKLATDKEYAEVPADTTDQKLTYFANLPSTWEKNLNPKLAAEETDPDLILTVLGTDKVDDVDVTVFEFELDHGTAITRRTFYVDSRFLTLKSELTFADSDEPDKLLLKTSSIMSEIDQPQDIADPRTTN